jgi:hypothetical protein
LDPVQCVKQLRQALAVDKLAVGFILGAGCPCSIRVSNGGGGPEIPLIPDVKGLTGIVRERLTASVEHEKAFSTLISMLEADKFPNPDVETMLSRVRALKEVAGNGEVRGLNSKDLKDLEQEITKAIVEVVDRGLPDRTSTPYHALARFVGSNRRPASEIFTMNYDLLMEQALEDQGIAYSDGFVGAARPFFDQRVVEEDSLPERWTRLWKLHGSINWRLNKEVKRVVRSRRDDDGDEVLVHPSHLKYDETRRLPFFVMIDRLRDFVRNKRQPVSVFILGYSFRDDHINQVIIDALRTNPAAACFALQHGDLSEYPKGSTLAAENTNLSVLARDAAVIRKDEVKWTVTEAMDMATLKGVFELEKVTTPGKPENGIRPCRLIAGDFKHFGRFLDGFVEGKTSTAGD